MCVNFLSSTGILKDGLITTIILYFTRVFSSVGLARYSNGLGKGINLIIWEFGYLFLTLLQYPQKEEQ